MANPTITFTFEQIESAIASLVKEYAESGYEYADTMDELENGDFALKLYAHLVAVSQRKS